MCGSGPRRLQMMTATTHQLLLLLLLLGTLLPVQCKTILHLAHSSLSAAPLGTLWPVPQCWTLLRRRGEHPGAGVPEGWSGESVNNGGVQRQVGPGLEDGLPEPLLPLQALLPTHQSHRTPARGHSRRPRIPVQGRWYQLCLTYDHLEHAYNTFMNGELVYELTYNVEGEIYGDNARLGQGDLPSESFSGALSQVNMWDSVLSRNAIASMAACKSDLQGNYISWEAGWELHNVTEYDASMESFCQPSTYTNYFGFPELPQAHAFYICEALGSHLPLPTTMKEVTFWYNLSYQVWPHQDNLTLCSDFLWSSITDANHDGTWVTHYDNALAPTVAWKVGEPNGLVYENCAVIEKLGLSDIVCATSKWCAICEFSDLHVFTLLGTCELEEHNLNFIAYQEGLGDLYFKGYGAYHIKKVEGEWLWINVVENKTLARLDVNAPFNMPMGRRIWHLESPVCNQREGPRTLVLTPCGPDSYSCDDATCIPHQNRCDQKYDCLDHSDEVACEIIGKPEDYKEDIPPLPGSDKVGTSLPITVNVTIESITIHTTQMTMQMSYKIQMIWFDNRLVYRNLKTNETFNKVNYTSMLSLWLPTLRFVGTEGHRHTTVDQEASLHVQRLRPPNRRDNTVPREVDLFSGEENSLILSRKYTTAFTCDFDLVLYPFDVQYCDMRFRMLSGSKDYLIFEEAASSATYHGSTLLLEYEVCGHTFPDVVDTSEDKDNQEIKQPKLFYDNSKEFSEMLVEITLHRRAGYAILNIYTPSLILLMISYVTLFFRPHVLEARIMTTLTALLVLATLFAQVRHSCEYSHTCRNNRGHLQGKTGLFSKRSSGSAGLWWICGLAGRSKQQPGGPNFHKSSLASGRAWGVEELPEPHPAGINQIPAKISISRCD
ncbi:uncharacterized protein [Procambarus clarkii]|uniref:uncharacterized protein isoform X2 n=1 Tax=Procambarus clarkii TaxID=6728 RepID=UPI003742A4F4